MLCLVALLITQFGLPGFAVGEAPVQAQEIDEVELVEKRSTYAKTYLRPDGSYRTRMATAPIHFQDSAGNWLEIDNTLIPAEGGGYRNAANEFKVHFAASGDATELVRAEFEGKSVAFGLDGASPVNPQVNGSEITYSEILPNMDVKFHVEGEMVKELVVLKAPPPAGQDAFNLSFPMKLGYVTSQELNDELTLRDSAGASVFSVPHLFMYDSLGSDTGGEPALSENIQLSLNGTGTSPTLTANVDANWLRDPARVYPVTIDPTTINDRRPMLDTFVQSNILNTGQSGSTELKSGYYSGPEGTFTAQSLIKFDLSDIPEGSTIDSSTLQIFNNHSYNCSAARITEIRRVDGSWNKDVTWSNKPALASVVAASKSFAYGATCPSGGARVDFNVQSLVSWWKNSTDPNYGFGVRAADQSDINAWRKYASNEASHVPWLDVVWSAPNRAPGLPTPISPTAGSTTGAFPTLKATYNDPDSGDTGYVEYEIYQSGTCCGNPLRYGSSGQVSPGGTTSWTPTHALADGDYTWRARGNDGLATSGWTSTIAFKVDTTAPAPPAVSSSSHPNGTTCSTNNAPGFSWTASDNSGGSGIAGYSYLLDRTQGTTPDTTMEGSGTSTSYSNVADGDSWFHIRARDNAGNWSTPSEYKINVNAIAPNPPSLTSSSHTSQTTWSTNDDPTFTWSLTDIFGINGYSYTIDQSSMTTPDTLSEGTGTSATYSNLNDGEWYFHVRGRDGCNLWGGSSDYRVRIDDTAPAAPSLSSSTHSSETTWYSHNDPTVAWSASDTSGIDGYSYLLDQSSTTQVDAISETSATSHTFTDVADGVWYVHARARNGAGLWSSATSHRKLQIDTTAPAAVTVSSSTHPDQTLTYANDDPSFSWIAPTDMSGVSGYSYILDQVSTTSPDNTIDGTTTLKSYANVAEGTSWFHVKTRDAAGNWSPVSHYKVTIETPAPMAYPVLSAVFRDAANEPVTKDGSQLTFSGPITQGIGQDAPADTEAQVTQCDLVAKRPDGTVAKRISVPLTSCRNSSGSLSGSYSPTFSIPSGSVVLEVKVERTKNGITKTSGLQTSAAVAIDNQRPVITKVLLGCDSEFPGVCEDETTIRVLLSEPVRGDFVAADFTVNGNMVLSATSDCTQINFCDLVTLTVGTNIDGDNPPTLTYSHLSLMERTRPHDGAHHQLDNLTSTISDPPAEPDGEPLHPEADPDDPAVDIPTTPLGQVLVVNANVLQVYTHRASHVEDCTAPGATASCNAEQRERAFARRIKKLGLKESGVTDNLVDGMGNVLPDILLLQEVRCADVRGIIRKLKARITVAGVAPNFRIAACRETPRYPEPDGNGDSGDPDNGIVTNETAIVYNNDQLDFVRRRTILTRYGAADRPNECTTGGATYYVDVDLDGENDCTVKWKRHFRALFKEEGSGRKVAVASIHIVPGGLNNAAQRQTLMKRWAEKIAEHVQRFGAANYVIGGDFNSKRCSSGLSEKIDREGDDLAPSGAAKELQLCAANAWWSSVTGPAYGYVDAVYDEHGDPVKANTQRDLDRQYFKGCLSLYDPVTQTCGQYAEAKNRIDFIFAKGLSSDPVVGASTDINCGVDDPPNLNEFPPRCTSEEDNWENPRRYTDHRLLWALVKLGQ